MQKVMDRDFLAALVLLTIGSVSLSQAGSDMMNWAFPRLATYFILFVAAVLIARVVFSSVTERVPDILRMSAEDKVIARDVFIFLVFSLCYLLVVYGLGFWLSSFLMLSVTSIYLTLEKTPKSIGIDVGVSLAICVVSYVIFQHLFYVPVPQAHWWPFAS